MVAARTAKKSTRCPPGTIKRKSYTRKGRKLSNGRRSATVKVSAACIRDVGAPRTFKQRHHGMVGIGKLRKNALHRFGYDPDLVQATRHAALVRADRKYGALRLFHMLNAAAVYTKNTDKKRHATYIKDRDWVKKQFF